MQVLWVFAVVHARLSSTLSLLTHLLLHAACQHFTQDNIPSTFAGLGARRALTQWYRFGRGRRNGSNRGGRDYYRSACKCLDCHLCALACGTLHVADCWASQLN